MLNLKAIKKRVEKVKNVHGNGPWVVNGSQQDGNGVTFLHFINPAGDHSPEATIAETLDSYEDDSVAQFIAHAWTDVQELVREVERLQRNGLQRNGPKEKDVRKVVSQVQRAAQKAFDRVLEEQREFRLAGMVRKRRTK